MIGRASLHLLYRNNGREFLQKTTNPVLRQQRSLVTTNASSFRTLNKTYSQNVNVVRRRSSFVTSSHASTLHGKTLPVPHYHHHRPIFSKQYEDKLTCSVQAQNFHTGSQTEAPAPATNIGSFRDDDTVRSRRNTNEISPFLLRIYSSTALCAIGMLSTPILLASTLPIGAIGATPLMIGGLIGGIASTTAISSIEPSYKSTDKGIVAVNSTARQLAMLGLVGSFGVMISPAFLVICATQPMVIPAALLATVSTMAGAGAYALRAKGSTIVSWRPALTGGLFGLLGVGLGGLGADYLGYHGIAQALHSVNTYGGVILFAGLTAYDTRIAVEMHASGQPDHLLVTSTLFMNFANLFTRFLHIFSSDD